MSQGSSSGLKIFKTEDYWAIWLGLIVIAMAVGFFYAGSTLKPWAVTPKGWATFDQLGADLSKHGLAYLLVYLGFGVVFTISMAIMGHKVARFVPGYTILFVGALAIFYLAGWETLKRLDLGAPLLALLIGLVIGNLRAVPEWFKTSLRTEYYIKTGIVLLGATLPLTLIAEAGPIAFVQATIVSVVTWFTIYLAATRLFKLDPRFGAVLGTGGAVCGVSGSIAVGGAVKADKDHIAVGIAVVSVWAIIMIFTLAILTKTMIPAEHQPPTAWWHMTPGEAGAWVGTSEYADAAGFAVVAELSAEHGDAPIQAFTLMKVIGRDIWIGIWALVLSIISVVFWELAPPGRGSGEPGSPRAAATGEGGDGPTGGGDGPTGRVGASVVWERFPKFVIGFFAASVIMSLIAARPPADRVAAVKWADTYKTKAEKQKYQADFSRFAVPAAVADRFEIDPEAKLIRFRGKMSREQFTALAAGADPQQRWALKKLLGQSDWFESELKAKAIGPIKALRSWAFVLCFLCIGLSTRFKELATFGLKPFYAFTIGVLVNVPLGYLLTTRVFVDYWRGL